MANNVHASPWSLDTAGAVKTKGTTIFPKSIRWVGPTTAGHTCILKDGAGRIVWRSVASGANFVDVDRPENYWDGLSVDTIGSGIIYIEI